MNPYFKEAEEIFNDIKAWRREIHKHPELSYNEYITSRYITDLLKEFGCEVRTGLAGGTGVAGIIHGEKPGKNVLFRADMDALPIQEMNHVTYSSQTPGIMHACGHDGHMAILLGAAKILTKQSSSLSGKVVFAFQPAEENGNGAGAMIADGILADPVVDAVFGIHLSNDIGVGKFSINDGPVMSSATPLKIIIQGKGGHGAKPHQTFDPIMMSSQIISSLQSIISRNVNPLDPAVLTIGSIHGGSAGNIIPESVELLGTIRTFIPETRDLMINRLELMLAGITSGYGGTYKLDLLTDFVPSVLNNPEISELVRSLTSRMFDGKSLVKTEPSMGSDDFAFYLDYVPGCYILIGSANEESENSYPIHNPRFDIDEKSLVYGTSLLVAIAKEFSMTGHAGVDLSTSE